ncbi:MAG: vitamin K epoxide reductase family protein [Candidatus Bathyarchaeia archaeon]
MRRPQPIYPNIRLYRGHVHAQEIVGDRSTMKRNVLFWGMVLFALIGLGVSAYLTYLSSTPPSSCPVDDFSIFSCDEVIWSRYSHFFGVSVAFLGLGWFMIALGLILVARHDRRFMIAVLAWSLLGVAGVAGFVYTEVFLLNSFCLWCTIAHVSGLAIFGFSVADFRTSHKPLRQLP